jgi:phosphatidylglycerol:prolipoprotein diacylglycerol transferase
VIPYFQEPALHIGPYQLSASAITAVLASFTSLWLILRRGYYKGVSVEDMLRLWFWMFVCAMVGARVYYVIVDDFEIFKSDPAVIFRISRMDSAGAVLGGLLGGVVWSLYKRLSWFEILRRFDIVAFATPAVFAIGRLGSTLAHDNRGIPSKSLLAVDFPAGPRFDLGLLEFLFLTSVAVLFFILDREPRSTGFFFGLFGVLYGVFRLAMSPLRTEFEHAYGITLVVIGIGACMMMRHYQRRESKGAVAHSSANP